MLVGVSVGFFAVVVVMGLLVYNGWEEDGH